MSSRIDIVLLLALIEWVVSKGQLLKQISLIYDLGPSICSSNNSKEFLISVEREILSFLTYPQLGKKNITEIMKCDSTGGVQTIPCLALLCNIAFNIVITIDRLYSEWQTKMKRILHALFNKAEKKVRES